MQQSTYLASSTWPKRNHFQGQSSRWAVFGHTGCWSIAKCSSFSTKLSSSRSFDNHDKTKKEIVKNSFENDKNLNVLGDLWEKLMNTFSTTRMRGCLRESCKREVGKEMFARGGAGGSCEVPTRTPACSYLLHRGRGRLTRSANRGGALQASYDKRRRWNCFQTWPLQAFRKVNILWGQRSVEPIKLVYTWRSWTTSIYKLSVTDFDPKGTISKVRVSAGLYLDILDAGRSPNTAESPRSSRTQAPDRLITMVKLKKKS